MTTPQRKGNKMHYSDEIMNDWNRDCCEEEMEISDEEIAEMYELFEKGQEEADAALNIILPVAEAEIQYAEAIADKNVKEDLVAKAEHAVSFAKEAMGQAHVQKEVEAASKSSFRLTMGKSHNATSEIRKEWLGIKTSYQVCEDSHAKLMEALRNRDFALARIDGAMLAETASQIRLMTKAALDMLKHSRDMGSEEFVACAWLVLDCASKSRISSERVASGRESWTRAAQNARRGE